MTFRTQSYLLTMASQGLVLASLTTVPLVSSNSVIMVLSDISITQLVHSLHLRAFTRAGPSTSNAHLAAPDMPPSLFLC